MALDLNSYFKLGLDSTDDGLDTGGILNTIRVAPETVSTLHNRVTFRMENQGLLTKDSGITVSAYDYQGGNSNARVNILSGILGAIKRCTVRIDDKILVDVEEPAHLETANMYSMQPPAKILDFNKSLIGNDFLANISNVQYNDAANISEYGQSQLSENTGVQYVGAVPVVRREKLSNTKLNNKKYFVHLSELSCQFLKMNMLPLFLMKDRNIELVLEFHNNRSRDWSFNGNIAPNANGIQVDLESIELIQSVVLPDQELMNQSIDTLQNQSANFPLIESYLVKSVLTTPAIDTALNYSPFLINCQNRELQRVLYANVDPSPSGTDIFGNQGSTSLGDYSYNWRINGSFLFDNNIVNSTDQYYLLSEYAAGNGLKVLNDMFVNNQLKVAQQTSTKADNRLIRGRMNYIGQSLRNGNQGIYGAGTAIRNPVELDLQVTPRSANFPDQVTKEYVMNFYVSNSKLLTINPNSVNITF